MQRSGQQRPGGRTRRTAEAVLAATAREIVTFGYDNFRIERVAAFAGVHRSTIYRRWGGKEQLLLDAAARLDTEELPDTGNVTDDLLGLLHILRDQLDPGRPDRHLLAAGATREEFTPHVRQLMADRLETAAQMVVRAVHRDELPAGTDAREVVRLAVAPLHSRALATQEALTDDVLHRAVTVAVGAARAGLLQRATSS